MEIIFLIFLAVLLITSYYAGKRSLISPWFLLCLSFFGAYIILLLNKKNWDFEISDKFIIYITTAILAFGAGCLIVNVLKRTLQRRSMLSDGPLFSDNEIPAVRYPANILLLVSAVCSAGYVLKTFADAAGTATSLSEILRNIYNLTVNEDYSPGFLFNQMMEISVAIAFISTFRLLVRIYTKGDRQGIVKLILPILFFLVVAVATTDRNVFLRYAIYVLSLWVVIYGRTLSGRSATRKIIFRAVILVIIAAGIFFLMGIAKQYQSGFLRQVSIYIASGLNDLNIWLQDFQGPLMYGESTFSQFMNTIGTIASIFGIKISGAVGAFDPFITYTNQAGTYYYSSNIYTSLRPYIEDFGYFGVILFPLIVGIVFELLFSGARQKKIGVTLLLYCSLLYAVIYFPISERFFRRFHLGLVYEIVWIIIVFWFAFKRKRGKRVQQTADKEQSGQP